MTVLADLLASTGADRVTLRLDVAGLNYPCIAEYTAPGVMRMQTDMSIDQRAAATARWIATHRRVLVQPDLEGAVPAAPQGLVDGYGVRAQMLAPAVVDGSVVGWVSVHSQRVRPWSAHDVQAVQAAADAVALDLMRWYGERWQRPAGPPPAPYGPLP